MRPATTQSCQDCCSCQRPLKLWRHGQSEEQRRLSWPAVKFLLCHQHCWYIQIKYVHWTYSLLVMTEAETFWKPSQYYKPLSQTLLKKDCYHSGCHIASNMQWNTCNDLRVSLSMMQFNARSNNHHNFPSPSLIFTFSLRSKCLGTSYREMHSVLSTVVPVSEFWSLITTKSPYCHCIVSETVSHGSF